MSQWISDHTCHMMNIQNRIGADIIMALDDVVKTTITGPRIEEAMYRTLRWIDRCIEGKALSRFQSCFLYNPGSYFSDPQSRIVA